MNNSKRTLASGEGKKETVTDEEIDKAIDECIKQFGYKTANDYLNDTGEIHYNINHERTK